MHRVHYVGAFDGVEIANDGTVPFRTGERISFNYLVSGKYMGVSKGGEGSGWLW